MQSVKQLNKLRHKLNIKNEQNKSRGKNAHFESLCIRPIRLFDANIQITVFYFPLFFSSSLSAEKREDRFSPHLSFVVPRLFPYKRFHTVSNTPVNQAIHAKPNSSTTNELTNWNRKIAYLIDRMKKARKSVQKKKDSHGLRLCQQDRQMLPR